MPSCIVCDRPLEYLLEDSCPGGGVEFTSRGNYGSAVFDSIDSRQHIEIIVCDRCLVIAGAVGQVQDCRKTITSKITKKQWAIGDNDVKI